MSWNKILAVGGVELVGLVIAAYLGALLAARPQAIYAKEQASALPRVATKRAALYQVLDHLRAIRLAVEAILRNESESPHETVWVEAYEGLPNVHVRSVPEADTWIFSD